MITTFSANRSPHRPLLYYVFWGADSESELKNIDFEKNWPHVRFKFLKMDVKSKNQKLNIMSNVGLLYKNDDRISNLASELKLDNILPLFSQKLSEIGLIRYFANFRQLFVNNGSNVIRFEFWGQIWNLLVSSHIIISPICHNFQILIFWLYVHVKKSNRTSGQFFRNRYLLVRIRNQRPKRHT